jgi:flagellar hook-associated protein 3 FlgL
MRISSQSIRDLFVDQLGRQQADLQRVQLQIATGLRFNRPAEDPIAASQSLDLQRAIDQNLQYEANAGLAENRLKLSESTLAAVGDNLQRLRELAIQASNATETPETRRMIATEVRQRLDALLQLANVQDGNGQYLYAGYSTGVRPFAATPGGYQYNGDQGQRLVQVGPGRQIADSDSGAAIFQLVRNGNGTFVAAPAAANTGSGVIGARGVADFSLWDAGSYSIVFTSATTYDVLDAASVPVPGAAGTYAPGQNISFRGVQLAIEGAPAAGDRFTVGPSVSLDVFSMVQGFVDALALPTGTPRDAAAFRNAMNASLEHLDQALGNVLQARADIGGRLQALETQQNSNTDLVLQLRTTLSQTRDLDYAEAVTRMNQQLTALQAAQASYVKVMGLSLFNYLR